MFKFQGNEYIQLISKYALTIIGSCAFIFFLQFKPSEPYLSEFLICNKNTQQEYCSTLSVVDCSTTEPCQYLNSSCFPTPCYALSKNQCTNIDSYDYCEYSSNYCIDSTCYKYFSVNTVNNEIYPWSTYAYFPFLLILGPYAELYSYRIAIIVGIFGRVITRFLLLFGTTLFQMQLMQVAYSMGTAAEDGKYHLNQISLRIHFFYKIVMLSRVVFSAYIYYTVPPELFTVVTSCVRASALLASLLAGINRII